MFYPAIPPAHWLMVAEIAGEVLVVPLAPSSIGQPKPMSPDWLLPRIQTSSRPIPERPMTNDMNSTEEHAFYAKPENQAPQGPVRRRRERLTEMVPVRFPADILDEIRRRADIDDRSVSAWIRRAVEHEIDRQAS